MKQTRSDNQVVVHEAWYILILIIITSFFAGMFLTPFNPEHENFTAIFSLYGIFMGVHTVMGLFIDVKRRDIGRKW